MKKFALALIIVLAVAVLAAPYVSGMIAERSVRQYFTNLNTMYREAGQDARVDIVHYQRGYASSEISWKLTSKQLQAFFGIDEVQLVDRAKHGFGRIVSTTSLEKNPWYGTLVRERLGGKDPLHITTEYSLSGAVRSTLALDALTVQSNSGTIAIQPGKMLASADGDFKHFLADASWGGLTMGDKINMAGLTVKADLTLLSANVWDGTVQLALPRCKMAKSESERFELSNMKVGYTLRCNKEQTIMSVMADYGFDLLDLEQYKVENGFVRVGMNGINVPAYKEFMAMYSRTMAEVLGEIAAAQGSADPRAKASERKMAMVGLQMMAAGEKLLTRGLELQIADLRMRLPEGEVQGNLTLRLNKDMTLLQFIPLAQQPALALDIFSLTSNFQLPQQLVGNNPTLLTPMFSGMRTGLLVPSGSSYVHKAETRDNKLLLNDQEVQLR